MKYPLLLTCALFIAITIFLAVPVTKGTDCTPSGTHLSDTTTGACGVANSDNYYLKRVIGVLAGLTDILTV